jgi:pimeloyl-ACP methyl ester carboxylesterase
MHLAGTLYHGWKSKRGLTVLMLHDLGSNRSSPGWKRLAEALQAEGHTVLTFDFRGHGDSRRVSSQFWRYPVNKYLNSYKLNTIAELQPTLLNLTDFPTEYRPWLIEDIVAARTYLDRLHDDPSGPVNTFNLVVLGAGQAAALGSLWLATEGLRYNGSDIGNKILLRWEEKRSVLQAVWIGMADPLKLRPFGIHNWLEGAHAKPAVPITFIYGEEDIDTYSLLSEPIRKKFGTPFVIPGARLSGQELLDTDTQAAARIQKYLVKSFQSLPPQSSPPVNWVPRKIKSLRSFWRLEAHNGKKKVVRWVVAKRVGDESLLPVPFLPLGIPIKGLEEPNFVPDDEEDP